MERGTKLALGGLLLAGGLGAGVYLLQRQRQMAAVGAAFQGITISTNPPQPLPQGQHPVYVTLRWTNASERTVNWGAQGAIVQAPPIGPAGLIGGHWWVSEAALQAALAAGTPSPLQSNPQYRLVTGTVQPGQTGQATFFSKPILAKNEVWLFWLAENPRGLIVGDPVGVSASSLPMPQSSVTVGVQ